MNAPGKPINFEYKLEKYLPHICFVLWQW